MPGSRGERLRGPIRGMRHAWRYVRSTPWLCDGMVLGATVATISSTSALAYSSALMRFPKLRSYGASLGTTVMQQAACHECNALRMYTLARSPSGNISPLLGFSMDTLVTEMLMSFVISFVIVTFSVFLVREMR